MKWGLFDKTYTMVLVGINTVARIFMNRILFQVYCVHVWMHVAACGSVYLTVLYSVFCDQDQSPVQTTTFFFPSVFILRKLQLQITNNCISFTGASEDISVSSTTPCWAIASCLCKCSSRSWNLLKHFIDFFIERKKIKFSHHNVCGSV